MVKRRITSLWLAIKKFATAHLASVVLYVIAAASAANAPGAALATARSVATEL